MVIRGCVMCLIALSTTFQLHPWAVTIGFVLMGGWGWKQEITDKLFH